MIFLKYVVKHTRIVPMVVLFMLAILGSILEIFLFKNIGEYFTKNGDFSIAPRFVIILIVARFLVTMVAEKLRSVLVWHHYQSVISGFLANRIQSDIWFLRNLSQEKLLRIVTKDIPHVGFVVQAIFVLVTDSILLLFILSYGLYIDTVLSLTIIAVGIALSLSVALGIKNVSHASTEKRKRADETLKGWILGVHTSFMQLHSLGVFGFVNDKMSVVINDRVKAGVTQSLFTQVPRILVENGVLLVVVLFMMNTSDTTGLLLVMPILLRAIPNASRINTSFSTLRFYKAEVLKVYETIESRAEENLRYDFAIDTNEANKIVLKVQFMRYINNMNLLNKAEFTFKKGLMNFLLGPSGAGKSTLLDLFIINTLKEKSSFNVCLIQQDAVMFNMSLEENITFGREYNEARFREICNGFGLSELIAKDGNKGASMHLGELSGGEKQRINLARGLSSCSEVYILDEPTNNIDFKSRVYLMELLKQMVHESIVICVSHDELFVEAFNSNKNINYVG